MFCAWLDARALQTAHAPAGGLPAPKTPGPFTFFFSTRADRQSCSSETTAKATGKWHCHRKDPCANLSSTGSTKAMQKPHARLQTWSPNGTCKRPGESPPRHCSLGSHEDTFVRLHNPLTRSPPGGRPVLIVQLCGSTPPCASQSAEYIQGRAACEQHLRTNDLYTHSL